MQTDAEKAKDKDGKAGDKVGRNLGDRFNEYMEDRGRAYLGNIGSR